MRGTPRLRFGALATLLLGAEAVAVLLLSGEGRHRILGHDGVEYERYARNLVDHGAFSNAVHAPYAPSVFRTPGYPTLLAAIRLAAGDSLLAVRVAQFALVGVTAWLVYRITLELADRQTARVAAVLVLTYLPFLWLARMHLTETVTTTLLAAIVLLLLRAEGKWWRYAAVGLLCGAVAMVRPVYGLAFAPIAACLVLWPHTSRRRAALQAGVVVAAFAVALTPWTARNLTLTHRLMPFGSGGSGTSLLASAEQYRGGFGYRWDHAELQQLDRASAPAIARGRAEAAREQSDVPLNVRQEIDTDRELRKQARSVLAGVTPTNVLEALPKRIAYLWAVSDYPPRASYVFWHRIGQAQHFLLLAFTLIGLGSMLRLRSRLWPVLAFPLYLTAAHLVLHSEARYSVPARPALIVLAAIGVTYVWRAVRSSVQPLPGRRRSRSWTTA